MWSSHVVQAFLFPSSSECKTQGAGFDTSTIPTRTHGQLFLLSPRLIHALTLAIASRPRVSSTLYSLHGRFNAHVPYALGEPPWTPQFRQSPAIGCLLIPNTNPSHHSMSTMQLFHYFCARETSVRVEVPAVFFLLPIG